LPAFSAPALLAEALSMATKPKNRFPLSEELLMTGNRDFIIALTAQNYCWRIVFAENRFPLFRTML
jgi:hypothetical protein